MENHFDIEQRAGGRRTGHGIRSRWMGVAGQIPRFHNADFAAVNAAVSRHRRLLRVLSSASEIDRQHIKRHS